MITSVAFINILALVALALPQIDRYSMCVSNGELYCPPQNCAVLGLHSFCKVWADSNQSYGTLSDFLVRNWEYTDPDQQKRRRS